MCFNNYFLGWNLPLFKMFELLPIAIALIIKMFSLLLQPIADVETVDCELLRTAPEYLLSFT